jgi:hypothetical protein
VKPMRLDVEDDHGESKKQLASKWNGDNDARYSEFMVRQRLYRTKVCEKLIRKAPALRATGALQ